MTNFLYIALMICIVGIVYRVAGWFRHTPVGAEVPGFAKSRVWAALKGVAGTVFSTGLFRLVWVFVVDVLFNVRILKEDVFRWVMHMCLYWGFGLLIVFHALGQYTGTVLANEYYSTVNPFLFLRDVCGVLVVVGVVLAVYRRLVMKVPRMTTRGMDVYAIVIVGVIIVSGFFLQSAQMVSSGVYEEMVENYSIISDKAEAEALEAYWVSEYGYVSPGMKGPFDEALLAEGRDVHEMNCAECHARAQWSFASLGVAKVLAPAAGGLEGIGAHSLLWYIHFFACLVGLAYMPFSKMFHIVATPLSLLVNAVMERGVSSAGNIATRQMLELDACTHCGTCSEWCSVIAAVDGNVETAIMPSEKLGEIKRLSVTGKRAAVEVEAFQKALFACSACSRCSVVCPAGINLGELWSDVRSGLVGQGYELECLQGLSEGIAATHNIVAKPNAQRTRWAKKVKLPYEIEGRDTAELVYFVGCITSFYPMVQDIARSFVTVLDRAGVDFAVLGGEEWCCGYPLLSAGRLGDVAETMRHNIERMQAMGVKRIVVTCPGCYRMWRDDYEHITGERPPFEILHSTELLVQLIEQGRLSLEKLDETVTYHDPCDLGRVSGVYEEPRRILRQVPGMRFVELKDHREYCSCCGSGGDMLVSNQDLSMQVARHKVEEVLATGAQTVVTACPSCVRALTMAKREAKGEIEIMDITQLVAKAVK